MSEELGSGLSMDEQFDLYVDDSIGDLSFSTGSEEVRKDLAFQISRLLTGVVGDFMTEGKKADIEIAVRKLVANDPRISEIARLEVREPESPTDTVEVDLLAVTVADTVVEDVILI
jgi:hypothetical protein